MKKKQLTQEQERFFKGGGKIIDTELANLLKDYSLDQIMKAPILIETDKENLTITIQIGLK